MGPFEIVVIVIAAVFVTAVIGWNVYCRLTGKSNGCGECGGCHSCHGCRHCAQNAHDAEARRKEVHNEKKDD